MTRTHVFALLALVIAVPAAAAAATSYFAASDTPIPCFVAGNAAYRVTGAATADYTVRVDTAAASPSLRLQLVDDPAEADFVLVDDSVATDACPASVTNIRVDAAATAPDVTVSLSRAPADHKIYVKSASFSEQDATALFAVIWKGARDAGLHREIAARR
jgi:fructose-specific component phosphotransferase system IIB-like protein